MIPLLLLSKEVRSYTSIALALPWKILIYATYAQALMKSITRFRGKSRKKLEFYSIYLNRP